MKTEENSVEARPQSWPVAGKAGPVSMTSKGFAGTLTDIHGTRVVGHAGYNKANTAGMGVRISRKYAGGSSPFLSYFSGRCGHDWYDYFSGLPSSYGIKIGCGDLKAIVGIVGLVAGIGIGIYFLNRGFSLGMANVQHNLNGQLFPLVTLTLLVLFEHKCFL